MMAAASAIAANATLDLNGNSETIPTLSGSGTVDNTAASSKANLAFGNGNSTFLGVIRSSGNSSSLSVIKSGTGISTLSGTNTYKGGTSVTSGTLAVSTTANVSMPYRNQRRALQC